ncbi:MAG: hypothetical protein K6T99_00445 [Armatimonadetes bacterium]|nr:hypothetical protein [Armatimonadota bacterium]
MRFQRGTFLIFAVPLLFALALGAGFAKVAIYEPTGWAQSSLAKISYRLNTTVFYLECTIYHADANGNPIGDPVQCESYYSESKGYHEHFFYGLEPGSYVAVLEAVGPNEPQWRPLVGIFKYNDPTVEYSPPNPPVPDMEGWYGIAINTRPNSPYFGWTYVPHKSYQDIYIYRGDGSCVGTMNDSGIYWGGSAPWDASVADDDYVYVGDRSNRYVYCFKPDGSGWVSCSPPITYSRGIFARTDSSGVTHVFVTGGFGQVYEVTVQSDHATWGTPAVIANLGSLSEDNFKIGGVWVSADLQTMFVCYDGKIYKFIKNGSVYEQASSPWPVDIPGVWDIDASPDGSILWASCTAAYNPPATYAIYKVNPVTGSATPVDGNNIVTWGHMIKIDAVGNPGVTYGKFTNTWGQYYWALFTEPGTSSHTVKTNVFHTTSDHLPVMTFYSIIPTSVPGDNTTTATLTAWIYDGAGWQDVSEVRVDLDPVGIQEDAVSTSLVRDTSDPTGRTVVATVPGLKAAIGAKVATHELAVTMIDSTSSSEDTVALKVTGVPVTFTIKHSITNHPIAGAFAHATGGMSGLPGYPFTYNSTTTNSNGQTTVQLSQGTYQVKAVKTGYGSMDPIEVVVGPNPISVDIYLRPCTVAEARQLPDSTLCNVKGVVYAQTCGPYTPPSPPEVLGLAERKDSGDYNYQWYVCDPNDPGNGILMMFPVPQDEYFYQMDDPEGTDPDGNSTYIGPRPRVGDTVMITGMLGTPSGHERRIKADISLQYKDDIYLNLGNQGGLPVSPIGLSIPEFMHGNISVHPCWGKYAITTGAIVVKNVPSGAPYDLGDPIPYIVIADVSGNIAEVAIEKPLTLGINTWPIPGATYNFRGPIGRRNRYGNGCIRPRGPSDIIYTAPAPPPGNPIGSVRELPNGEFVNVQGIVTAVFATCFYIESADRASGIRVNASVGSYVSRGDVAQVIGTLGITDGERSISPSQAVIVHGTTTVPAPIGVRNRDLGGAGAGADNPGVTGGRGALNVGLLVKVTGTVTHVGSGFFYIWDGSNRTTSPLDDGSGFNGIRITTNRSASIGDRMEIVGISSTDTYNVPPNNIPTIMPRDNNDFVINPPLSNIQSPEGTVGAGWNLLGIPAIPGNWDPQAVFGSIPINDNLCRWEAEDSSFIFYDEWSPSTYGGMLLGDGFWLSVGSPTNISYQGRYQPEDQWVTLPKSGWTLIGHTFDYDTYWSDVKVHNGCECISMEEASRERGWLNSMGWWWENSSQSLMTLGLPDDWPESEKLERWHGYWIYSNTDSLSLIIPASPSAP